jgi:hypothetical protein
MGGSVIGVLGVLGFRMDLVLGLLRCIEQLFRGEPGILILRSLKLGLGHIGYVVLLIK